MELELGRYDVCRVIPAAVCVSSKLIIALYRHFCFISSDGQINDDDDDDDDDLLYTVVHLQ